MKLEKLLRKEMRKLSLALVFLFAVSVSADSCIVSGSTERSAVGTTVADEALIVGRILSAADDSSLLATALEARSVSSATSNAQDIDRRELHGMIIYFK